QRGGRAAPRPPLLARGDERAGGEPPRGGLGRAAVRPGGAALAPRPPPLARPAGRLRRLLPRGVPALLVALRRRRQRRRAGVRRADAPAPDHAPDHPPRLLPPQRADGAGLRALGVPLALPVLVADPDGGADGGHRRAGVAGAPRPRDPRRRVRGDDRARGPRLPRGHPDVRQARDAPRPLALGPHGVENDEVRATSDEVRATNGEGLPSRPSPFVLRRSPLPSAPLDRLPPASSPTRRPMPLRSALAALLLAAAATPAVAQEAPPELRRVVLVNGDVYVGTVE